MVNTRFKRALLISACIVAVMFGLQGMKAFSTLNAKSIAQDAVTESVVRWKEMFTALGDSRKQWERSYRREDSIEDMVSLLNHIGFDKYGVETDDDNAFVTKVEPVVHGESPLGLTKVCLGTGVGDGATLFLRSTSYTALLTGIDKLAGRPDIAIGNITLQGDKAFPLAKLGDFCVLFRTS